MIKRKLPTDNSSEKEKRIPRKKKIKIDMSTLKDAVVDGKLVAVVKSKVVFERTLNGTTRVHEGTIHSFNEEKGIVELFDDTVEQFYSFSLKQKLPIIKIMG